LRIGELTEIDGAREVENIEPGPKTDDNPIEMICHVAVCILWLLGEDSASTADAAPASTNLTFPMKMNSIHNGTQAMDGASENDK